MSLVIDVCVCARALVYGDGVLLNFCYSKIPGCKIFSLVIHKISSALQNNRHCVSSSTVSPLLIHTCLCFDVLVLFYVTRQLSIVGVIISVTEL